MTHSSLSRDYQWVTNQLAIGSAVSLKEHVQALIADGVSHVLDCRIGDSAAQLYSGTGIIYRQRGIADDGKPKSDEWFFQGIEFVLGALKWPNSRALVHCRFGMSRSPSMVFAILCATGVPPADAEERIVKARAVAKVTYRQDAERAGRRWALHKGRPPSR